MTFERVTRQTGHAVACDKVFKGTPIFCDHNTCDLTRDGTYLQGRGCLPITTRASRLYRPAMRCNTLHVSGMMDKVVYVKLDKMCSHAWMNSHGLKVWDFPNPKIELHARAWRRLN